MTRRAFPSPLTVANLGPMLDYFTMLAQQVIHDPNSPLRNDEFYIPVMQAVLASLMQMV